MCDYSWLLLRSAVFVFCVLAMISFWWILHAAVDTVTSMSRRGHQYCSLYRLMVQIRTVVHVQPTAVPVIQSYCVVLANSPTRQVAYTYTYSLVLLLLLLETEFRIPAAAARMGIYSLQLQHRLSPERCAEHWINILQNCNTAQYSAKSVQASPSQYSPNSAHLPSKLCPLRVCLRPSTSAINQSINQSINRRPFFVLAFSCTIRTYHPPPLLPPNTHLHRDNAHHSTVNSTGTSTQVPSSSACQGGIDFPFPLSR